MTLRHGETPADPDEFTEEAKEIEILMRSVMEDIAEQIINKLDELITAVNNITD